jgi:hypothetical protein
MHAGSVGTENVFNVFPHGHQARLAPHNKAMTVTGSYRQLPANHDANNTRPEKLRFMAINR